MKKQKNELVEAIVAGLQDKKGRDIVVADLTDITDAVCRSEERRVGKEW